MAGGHRRALCPPGASSHSTSFKFSPASQLQAGLPKFLAHRNTGHPVHASFRGTAILCSCECCCCIFPAGPLQGACAPKQTSCLSLEAWPCCDGHVSSLTAACILILLVTKMPRRAEPLTVLITTAAPRAASDHSTRLCCRKPSEWPFAGTTTEWQRGRVTAWGKYLLLSL